MSDTTVTFVKGLVARFPSLTGLLKEHVTDNFGEVLPHLFFGDMTRHLVDLYRNPQDRSADSAAAHQELRGLLDALEDAYKQGESEIRELISDCLLELLPTPPKEPGWQIRSELGPQLLGRLREIG